MKRDNIGRLLKGIENRMSAHLDIDMKKHDLTFSQMHVLLFLEKNSGQATQKEIEDFLNVSHPTVVGLVKRLEKNDYVHCEYAGDNRNNKIVYKSEKADAVRDELKREGAAYDKLMTKGLSSQEKKELLRMLNIIYDNVTEEER